jgi:hypothetical protein
MILMKINQSTHRVFISIFVLTAVILTADRFSFGAWYSKTKKKGSYVMTQVELQSELMSFADRYATYIFQAFRDYDANPGSAAERREFQRDTVLSTAAAFTIAAESNPEAALLDMVSLVTLGSLIYEEHWLKTAGQRAAPMVQGFQKAEKEIWGLATKFLNPEQEKALYGVIESWRKNHPNQLGFAYVRFDDFGAERKKSTAATTQKSGGMFQSVTEATQQVEEARLLAERGIYLATRLPLLTGAFADWWVSQVSANPEVKETLADFHNLSAATERLTSVAEQLPEKIAKERDVTIKQAFDAMSVERIAAIDQILHGLANERANIIKDLIAEDQSVKGLATELRQTIVEGNKLLTAATVLLEKINTGVAPDGTADTKPFDIKEYHDTIRATTQLVEASNRLVNTAGLEKLIEQLVITLDKVEDTGEELVDHTFRQGVILIVILLVGYVIAKLAYDHISRRRMESKSEST